MNNSNDYHKDYYMPKLKQGNEYEDFVYEQLYYHGLPIVSYKSKKNQWKRGENIAGFEIKFDNIFKNTRRLWIETKEKSNPNIPEYSKSGIFREDNSWIYIIGDYSIIFIFSKTILKRLSKNFTERENNKKTSMGFYLDKKTAEMYAAKIITPVKIQLAKLPQK